MRARSGCASAFAIRASEVSPGGRFRLLPDEVLELVGMVGRKRTRQTRDNARNLLELSVYAPTRDSQGGLRDVHDATDRDTLRNGLKDDLIITPNWSAPLTDPPIESDPCRPPARPDQTSREAAERLLGNAGRAGGAPALPSLPRSAPRPPSRGCS